jgi:hypothetical protein
MGRNQKVDSEENQPERVLDLKPGTYSDGHPLDEVRYLECKLILKPDHFSSVAIGCLASLVESCDQSMMGVNMASLPMKRGGGW